MRIADTHQSNQWSVPYFTAIVDDHERQEVRAAAAYETPIDLVVIRGQVVRQILTCAVPAGNA